MINKKVGHFSNLSLSLSLFYRKFNCINDNLQAKYKEENELIKSILDDFYLSLFPKQSKFELNENSRNRFSYMKDYRNWKKRKNLIQNLIYFVFLITILISLKVIFIKQRRKFVRKLINI